MDPSSPIGAPQPPNGGVRGAIATALRSIGSGYEAATSNAAQEAEAAVTYPVVGVAAVTRSLRDATAEVPVVRKATQWIDRLGSAMMLGRAATVVEGYRAPGGLISGAAHAAADLLDGQDSNASWNGVATIPSAVGGVSLLPASDTGELLASLGVR